MTDLTEERLRECPFCGKQPRVVEDDSYGSCGVFCVCEPEPGVQRDISKLSECMEAWNKRASSQVVNELVGAAEAFDADLSDGCDGEPRDRLRAALTAARKMGYGNGDRK